MRPFGARPALVSIDAVATKHDERHTVTPCVVNGHGGMLKAHTAVRHHSHWFARRFGVAVGNGHRRFFMQARDQLGGFVAAIVHHRFMQAAKT